MTDGVSLVNLIREIQPDEVYNLAAQSHVKVSFEMPEYTASADGIGTIRLLEAIRAAELDTPLLPGVDLGDVRRDAAAAGREHGVLPALALRRGQALRPLGHGQLPRGLRHVRGLAASLFNHESPRRGETFVTRKITRAVARIKAGVQDELVLGNIDSVRDWGYAKEYVEGMWRMLQHDEPTDFVLATGTGTTVREFCEMAFSHVGLDWQDYVTYDERYERPTEVDALLGDPSQGQPSCSAGRRETGTRGARPASWSTPTSRCFEAART